MLEEYPNDEEGTENNESILKGILRKVRNPFSLRRKPKSPEQTQAELLNSLNPFEGNTANAHQIYINYLIASAFLTDTLKYIKTYHNSFEGNYIVALSKISHTQLNYIANQANQQQEDLAVVLCGTHDVVPCGTRNIKAIEVLAISHLVPCYDPESRRMTEKKDPENYIPVAQFVSKMTGFPSPFEKVSEAESRNPLRRAVKMLSKISEKSDRFSVSPETSKQFAILHVYKNFSDSVFQDYSKHQLYPQEGHTLNCGLVALKKRKFLFFTIEKNTIISIQRTSSHRVTPAEIIVQNDPEKGINGFVHPELVGQAGNSSLIYKL